MRDSVASLFSPRWLLWGLVGLFFLIGLGIRLYDLTDPPFDFQATRQFRSALIARGMYFENAPDVAAWQREMAVAQWHNEAVIEPPVIEWLTAQGYRLAGEADLWIARLLSAVFWLLGGAALFALCRRLVSTDGALFALIYYLCLPYGVIASRSFQPDPSMTALMVGAVWAAYRWHQEGTMRAAVLAGVLAGLAIFVKSVAVFMLGGALVGLVVLGYGVKGALKNRQAWALAALTAAPTVLYSVYGLWISGFLRQQLKFRFFPEMLKDFAFYVKWGEVATGIIGFSALLAALLGIVLLRGAAKRGLAAGLWAGYAVYSLTFPYHTLTHDYYQLPLIPIVALCLAPVGDALFRQLASIPRQWLVRAAVMGIVLFGVLFRLWDVRVNLARKDYRGDAQEWAELGAKFASTDRVIALTHAYGYPLAYYGWVRPSIWLSTNDAELRELAGLTEEDIARKRAGQLAGQDYFLITNFNQLNAQPDLKDMLYNGYEIKEEGPGFVIFDLHKPK